MSCLLLDCTLIELYDGYGVVPELHNLGQRSRDDIERDLYVAATSFCRSLPFCCEPETTSVGRLGTFLLRIAQNYFKEAGHFRELEWCRAFRRLLEDGNAAVGQTTASNVVKSFGSIPKTLVDYDNPMNVANGAGISDRLERSGESICHIPGKSLGLLSYDIGGQVLPLQHSEKGLQTMWEGLEGRRRIDEALAGTHGDVSQRCSTI